MEYKKCILNVILTLSIDGNSQENIARNKNDEIKSNKGKAWVALKER